MFVQDNQRSMHFCLVKQWSWDLNKSSSTVTFIMYHNWLIWLQSLHIQYYLKRHEYSFHLHSTQFSSIQVLLSYTARWCPKPLHFLTRWVSRLLGLALVSWATATVRQVLVSIAFSLRLPYLGVFPFTLLHLPFLRPTYPHSFYRPFTNSLFRWVSRLGTDSSTPCFDPRGRAGVRMEHTSQSIQISALIEVLAAF